MFHYLIVLILAGLLAGCAHHAVETTTTDSQGGECMHTDHARQEPGHCHGHDNFSEEASIFGYLIFRVVVEGIVHAIVYR